LIVDVVYLAVWQSVAPMSAVLSEVTEGDGRVHSYQQCAYTATSTSIHFFIAAAVVKSLWLVVGVMLAISTRTVSDTFNESKQIAMAIYNVIFALGLILSLVEVVGAQGDTLIILLLFLITWVAFFTLLILTLPNLLKYRSSATVGVAEIGPAMPLSEGRAAEFSFLSLSALKQWTVVTQYVDALEKHLTEAKARALTLKGGGIGGPSRKMVMRGSQESLTTGGISGTSRKESGEEEEEEGRPEALKAPSQSYGVQDGVVSGSAAGDGNGAEGEVGGNVGGGLEKESVKTITTSHQRQIRGSVSSGIQKVQIVHPSRAIVPSVVMTQGPQEQQIRASKSRSLSDG
jgi:hypothetical protein